MQNLLKHYVKSKLSWSDLNYEKLTYRDKLLELAYIYNVKEIQDYVKRRKDLTTGQIELILKKNKIIIPKDYNTTFFKENVTKPISKLKSNIIDYKDEKIRDKNRFFRKIENYKHDTSRKVNHGINNLWRNIGIVGLNFLNIIPKLGTTVGKFLSNLFTDVFNAIYNQQIDQKSARNVIIGFFTVVGITTVIVAGISKYNDFQSHGLNKDESKIEKKLKKVEKKPKLEEKKPKLEEKKPELKTKIETKKPELKVKRNNVAEVILPDLNLKTETVIQLSKDVDYDLRKVRTDKLVKPIYLLSFLRFREFKECAT